MAEVASVPVDEAEHVQYYGEGRARCARERVLRASPHKVSEGGSEGVVVSACLPEPGTRAGEGIGHGYGEGSSRCRLAV